MHLFVKENAELLVSVSRLSLAALDRLLATQPMDEFMPAGEIAALTRLISSALTFGLAGSRELEDQPDN